MNTSITMDNEYISEMIKTYKNTKIIILSLFILSLFSECSREIVPESDLDTPIYHYKAGARALDRGDYYTAKNSFEHSIALNKKFALGYGGLGLTYAYLGDNKKAKRNIGKAKDGGKNNPDVLVLCARGWIAMRESEKKWFKNAENLLKNAMKSHEDHESALYYLGEINLYRLNFRGAENYFRKVVEKKGEYMGKADDKWNLSQKIIRAMPGTLAGKKVALHEKITRADLSILFVEELKVEDLFAKLNQANSSKFYSPTEFTSEKQTTKSPPDVQNHWASVWIKDILRYDILNVSPDDKFYPDKFITRAEYAIAIQRILAAATNDESIETRYFGESPSRFNDVPSSHPAYNAMAICTERGIMQADVITGKFDSLGPVSGPDALLIIRTLQKSLRVAY